MLTTPPALLFLITLAASLHFHHASEDEIALLQKQQSAFEAKINQLLANITSIENQVDRTPQPDERIVVLEQAIKA